MQDILSKANIVGSVVVTAIKYPNPKELLFPPPFPTGSLMTSFLPTSFHPHTYIGNDSLVS